MRTVLAAIFGVIAFTGVHAVAKSDLVDSPDIGPKVYRSSCREPRPKRVEPPIEGVVMLEFVVDQRGNLVRRSVTVTSTDNPLLNETAIKMLTSCRFKAAIHQGENVRAKLGLKFTIKTPQ